MCALITLCAFSSPAKPRFGRRLFIACSLAIIAIGSYTPLTRAEGLSDREFAVLLSEFQIAVDTERRRYQIPGMTAAFVLPDGRLGKVASGSADLERREAITPDSRMLSGSIGKTVTSAVAVKLAEHGVWSLDDKLSRYLGRNAWFPRLPNAEHLTVRLLLQHRAELENYYDNPRFFDLLRRETAANPSYAPTFETLINFVADRPPLFAPGDGFKYTDVGYLLVGLAIEQATGRPYYETARALLLDPLGLNLTSPSNVRRLPGLTQGYANGQNALLQGPQMLGADGQLTYNPSIEFTAGGFVTNAGDLARWARALYSARILSPASVASILEQPSSNAQSAAGSSYYGLGVRVSAADLHTPASYGHDGYIPGYRSSMRYYPKFGVAIALQLNTEDGLWEELSGGGKDALQGHVDLSAIRERLSSVVLAAVSLADKRAGDPPTSDKSPLRALPNFSSRRLN